MLLSSFLVVLVVVLLAFSTSTFSSSLASKSIDVSVSINVSKLLSQTDDIFACVCLDWWPIDKCDYGNCPWNQNSSILNIDLTSPILQNAVKAFDGNVHLRLGGSLGDFVIYNVTDQATLDGYCKYKEFSLPTNSTRIGYEFYSGCLSMDRWDELNSFCTKTNCGGIVFGLNGLYGRNLPIGQCAPDINCHTDAKSNPCCTNVTGLWDQSQSELFVKYNKEKGYNIYAYELGNELVGSKGIQSHVTVPDYTTDWGVFTNLLKSVYSDAIDKKPRTVATDTTWDTAWMSDFLDGITENAPDIVTHHLYSLGAGSDPNVWMYALNNTYLDKVKTLGDQVLPVVKQWAPKASIWLGEGGGAYNSGGNNVTNAFNSGFWYLDQLAVLASKGHGSFCRQTLAGGFYSLLDITTFIPNPDYYTLLLWSKLMDKRVLQTTAEDHGLSKLRSYAHCTSKNSPNYKSGSITMVFINLSNETSLNLNEVTVSDGVNLITSEVRVEYVLSSGALISAENATDERTLLASRQILLNGKLLEVSTDSGSIPQLVGVEVAPNTRMVIQPLTYGFVEFPTANAQMCASM